MGKGSRARPFEVDQTEFADAWERTFGKKEKDIKEESHDNKTTEKDENKKTK